MLCAPNPLRYRFTSWRTLAVRFPPMNDTDFPRGSSTRAGILARGSFILVVDDEPAILSMIETVLKDKGWAVKIAQDSETAMATVEQATVPPVVLICDIMMKGLNGFELTRRLLARVPRLKAIFMSAHVAEVSWWPADLRDTPFLSKPFTNEELIGAVREALSS